MNKRPIQIVNSFRYISGYIFEIHYLDIPDTAPKSEQYQWFLNNNNNLIKLGFKKMDDQRRWFMDGTYLDMAKLELYYENYIYYLQTCNDADNKKIENMIN